MRHFWQRAVEGRDLLLSPAQNSASFAVINSLGKAAESAGIMSLMSIPVSAGFSTPHLMVP
jgi:hypothetical protein